MNANEKAHQRYTAWRISAEDAIRSGDTERVRGKLREALELDYYAMLRRLAEAYDDARCKQEDDRCARLRAENDAARPSVLPGALPAGTPVLWGSLHGLKLPSAARLEEYKSRVPGYGHETVREYVCATGERVSAEDIDWRTASASDGRRVE